MESLQNSRFQSKKLISKFLRLNIKIVHKVCSRITLVYITSTVVNTLNRIYCSCTVFGYNKNGGSGSVMTLILSRCLVTPGDLVITSNQTMRRRKKETTQSEIYCFNVCDSGSKSWQFNTNIKRVVRILLIYHPSCRSGGEYLITNCLPPTPLARPRDCQKQRNSKKTCLSLGQQHPPLLAGASILHHRSRTASFYPNLNLIHNGRCK
jgi:hypothetical protein